MSTKKQHDEQTRTWIRREAYAILKTEAQNRGIKILDILDYLMLTMKRYDLLSQGWEEKLTSARMTDYKEKIDAQLRAGVEKDKLTWRNRMKHDLILQYVKTLEPQDRKEFIETLIPDMNEPDFIERIGAIELILLDGKRQAVRLDEHQKPIFPKGIEIIACSRGYHTKDKYCECDFWKDCDIRKQEYTDFRFRISPEGKQARRMEQLSERNRER